jgi:DNA-binding response OmpR family regulator
VVRRHSAHRQSADQNSDRHNSGHHNSAGRGFAGFDVRYSAIYIVDGRGEEYARVDSGIRDPRVRVEVLSTASEALRIPCYQAPLFFVVNVDLPDMSGFDLREMLIERWPQTPGYLIGDSYDPQDEVKARCSGATLYFCKPLAPGWLAAALRPESSKL